MYDCLCFANDRLAAALGPMPKDGVEAVCAAVEVYADTVGNG